MLNWTAGGKGFQEPALPNELALVADWTEADPVVVVGAGDP